MPENFKLNLNFPQVPKNLKLYFYGSWVFALVTSVFAFTFLLQAIYVYKPKIKSKAKETIVDISITNFTKKDLTKQVEKKDKKVLVTKPKKQVMKTVAKNKIIVKKTKKKKKIAPKTVSSLFSEVNITAEVTNVDDILDESVPSKKPIKIKPVGKKAVKKQVQVITATKPSKTLKLSNTNDKIRLANVKTDDVKVTEPMSNSSTRVYKYSQEFNISDNIVESEGIENAYIDGIRNFINKHIKIKPRINDYVKFVVGINKNGQFTYKILGSQGSQEFVDSVRQQIKLLQKKGLPKPKRFLEIEVNIYGKNSNN